MPAMANKFDTRHLRQEWFPRLDRLLASAHFAKNRYRVQRVCVCAIVLSQDEHEIRSLNKQMPMFSVTQDKLDWQAEEDQSVGDVFTHLMRMSDCPSKNYLLENVESPEFAASPDSDEQDHSYSRQSFRLSSLEVYNGDCSSSPGYHIGATAFQKLTDLRDSSDSDELWRRWLNKYIIEFDESPRIVWAREGVTSAVLWQVQLDIIDSTSRFRKSTGGVRRRRYGAFSQVYLEDAKEEHAEDGDEPEAKRFRGVRYRPERKKWVAEMRLPKGLKKNKVSFGDYESEVQAARAVDVAFHHYGKEVNFRNTAEILKAQPALKGLDGEAKLRLVKDQAKWVANQVMHAPLQPACAPSTITVKIPDASSSQDSTAAPNNFMLSSHSPSMSLESLESLLLSDDSSGDEGSSTPAQLVAAPDMDAVANDDSASFPDQTWLSMLQFCCSMGSDPGDLLAICSPSPNSTLLPVDSPLLSFQEDDADHRLWEPENYQFWNHFHEQDSLFSGL